MLFVVGCQLAHREVGACILRTGICVFCKQLAIKNKRLTLMTGKYFIPTPASYRLKLLGSTCLKALNAGSYV